MGTLIATALGTGMVALPYAIMVNGFILGSMLMLLGGALTYFSGMMLVKVSEKTGKIRYEDIALAVYGEKASRFTSMCNIACMVGILIT